MPRKPKKEAPMHPDYYNVITSMNRKQLGLFLAITGTDIRTMDAAVMTSLSMTRSGSHVKTNPTEQGLIDYMSQPCKTLLTDDAAAAYLPVTIQETRAMASVIKPNRGEITKSMREGYPQKILSVWPKRLPNNYSLRLELIEQNPDVRPFMQVTACMNGYPIGTSRKENFFIGAHEVEAYNTNFALWVVQAVEGITAAPPDGTLCIQDNASKLELAIKDSRVEDVQITCDGRKPDWILLAEHYEPGAWFPNDILKELLSYDQTEWYGNYNGKVSAAFTKA